MGFRERRGVFSRNEAQNGNGVVEAGTTPTSNGVENGAVENGNAVGQPEKYGLRITDRRSYYLSQQDGIEEKISTPEDWRRKMWLSRKSGCDELMNENRFTPSREEVLQGSPRLIAASCH